LCNAIVDKAEKNSNEASGETSFSASEEYAACARMHKKGNVEAMAAFLRAFPGGMLEDIVRAELDAATRPTYNPNPGSGWRPLGASNASEAERATRVWRLAPWSVRQVLERLDRRWLWAGAVIVGAAILALVFSLMGQSQRVVRPSSGSTEVRRLVEREGGANMSLSPPEARAETPRQSSREVSSAVAAQLASTHARMPLPSNGVTQAGSTSAFLPVVSGANSAVTEQPNAQQAGGEPVSPAAEVVSQTVRTNVSAPAQAAVIDTHAYDATRLEASVRDVVALARRNQARAIALAASHQGEGGGGETLSGRDSRGPGVYGGEWSNGAAVGLGRAVWANGDRYEGAWRNSRPDGTGVLNLSNGLRYEGELTAGTPTGRGVFWGNNGRRLVGDQLFAALVAARSH
jgi:hypothetical protein